MQCFVWVMQSDSNHMAPLCVGSLLAAWCITVYSSSSGIYNSKDMSLCSYRSTSFLFHLMPLLTGISIQCILFHIDHSMSIL